MKSKHKVFLLHNIIAPYKLPLFEELAKEWDLEVEFCKGMRKDRLWKTTLSDYSFKHEVLRDISIGPVSLGPFVINYTLPFKLLLNRYDVYIFGITFSLSDILSAPVTLFIAKLLRTPFIAWSEYTDVDYSKFVGDKLGKIIETFVGIYIKFVCRYSDFFIVSARRTKECLIKHGAFEEKIFVSPLVMPEEQIKKVSIPKFETEYRDKKVILYLGYLRKNKGVDYLIRAFKRLKTEDTALIIAGAGPEEEKLKFLAKDDENIYFVGYVEKEEKTKYYSIADIFVLPTLLDAWGLVVNEAMYFGLPVITTNAAGASELINGNGFVVKAGDEEELRRAIEKLLDDEEMRREMGLKSREIIKDYTVEYAVKAFNEAIERAVMEKVK